MTKRYKKDDLPKSILKHDGNDITVTTDTSDNLVEVHWSSAPDLTYPSIALSVQVDASGKVAFEETSYAIFPDPDDDDDFIEETLTEELGEPDEETKAEHREEREQKFHEWASGFIDVLQYLTEAHRSRQRICSFCLHSEKEVDQMLAGPRELGICDRCVDLCEDALAEEEAHGKDS